MSSTASLYQRNQAVASNNLLLKGDLLYSPETEVLPLKNPNKPIEDCPSLIGLKLHLQAHTTLFSPWPCFSKKHTAYVRQQKDTHLPPLTCLSDGNTLSPAPDPSWEEETFASPVPTPGAAGAPANFMCAEPHVIFASAGNRRALMFNEVKPAQAWGQEMAG